jgi:pSer/pThr/pTyr-binding forkhead associated (FHA) protein
MRLEIAFNDDVMPVDLVDGRVTVGGGPTDDIRLEGLPHGLLTLTLENGQVQVRAIRSLRIGKALFPANVPRLVVPGEELKLPNDVVLRQPVDARRRESRRLAGTAFVAKELLSGDVQPEDTRAATFTCVTGYDKGLTFPIASSTCSIGRADDAQVRLRDRAVSRQHARLYRRGGQWFIKPLSDMNGTFLNGLRMKTEQPILHGDVLELGQTLLRFGGPERAPDEHPAPPAQVPASAPPPPTEKLAPDARPVLPDPAEPQPPAPRVPSEVFFMVLGALLAATGLAVTLLLGFAFQ